MLSQRENSGLQILGIWPLWYLKTLCVIKKETLNSLGPTQISATSESKTENKLTQQYVWKRPPSTTNTHLHTLLTPALLTEPKTFFSFWALENYISPAFWWQWWRSLFPLDCALTPFTDLLLREPLILVEYQWTEGEKYANLFQPVLWEFTVPLLVLLWNENKPERENQKNEIKW